MTLAVGAFLLSWVLLTASLVLQHFADGDGVGAVIWALVPTLGVFALTYLGSVSPRVTQDVLSFGIAGGFFILTGVNFSKALRLFRGSRA